MKSLIGNRFILFVGLLLLFGPVAYGAAAQDVLTGHPILVAESPVDVLAANGDSETTLLAFLATAEGSPIDGELVRFVLVDGAAFLSAPEAGFDFGPFGVGDESLLEAAGQANGEELEEITPSNAEGAEEIAVDGVNVGNGVYAARLRAGEVEGPVVVAAQWLTAPTAPIPEALIEIDLVSAGALDVRSDNLILDAAVLPGDEPESATVAAYILDELGLPMEDVGVSFSLVEGTGELLPLELPAIDDQDTTFDVEDYVLHGSRGRYAATYIGGETAEEAVVEVSLPLVAEPLLDAVTIDVVEPTAVSAIAFPRQVGRRLDVGEGAALSPESIASILVTVRDGEGDLVGGLTEANLEARVTSGPGEIIDMTEIPLATGAGSGVYQFTFLADDSVGTSLVEIINLDVPTLPHPAVEIATVTEVEPSVTEATALRAFQDDLLFADGLTEVLILAFAADTDGNPVRGLTPEFLVVEGEGEVAEEGIEVAALDGELGTGIYATTFVTPNSALNTTAAVRAIFTRSDAEPVAETLVLDIAALELPSVMVFPPVLPSSRPATAVIDIYDVNDQQLSLLPQAEDDRGRFVVEIVEGPGEIIVPANNDGVYPDFRADDNIYSALYAVSEAAPASESVVFRIADRAVVGLPAGTADLRLSRAIDLRAAAVPAVGESGQAIEIVAFAVDEFGLPAIGHELVMTIAEGSAATLGDGLMIDTGDEIAGFDDAFANDGVYVGAIETTGVAEGPVVVRITDLSVPTLPTVTLEISIDGAVTFIRGAVEAVEPDTDRAEVVAPELPEAVPEPSTAVDEDVTGALPGLCTIRVETDANLNLRTGPGLSFPVIATFGPTEVATVSQQVVDVEGNVWFLTDDNLWVRTDALVTEGPCDALPLLER